MSHEAYPSQENISTYLGEGAQWAREFQFASWLSILGSSNQNQFVYSGLDLSIGPGLSVGVAAGVAVVDGRILKLTAAENLGGLVSSATNYVYLQATLTSDRITSFALVSNISGIMLANSALLGTAITAGGFTTSVFSTSKKESGMLAGTYIGNGAASRAITLGKQPKLVMILLTNDFLDAFLSLINGALSFSGLGNGSSVVGYKISAEPGPPSTVDSLLYRPELTTTGFLVGDSVGIISLNVDTFTYYYWAWL